VILSDRDIKTALVNEEIVIKPLDHPEVQIQPASVDLRLSNEFVVSKDCYKKNPTGYDTRHTDPSEFTEKVWKDRFVINPGEFVLATTLEWVKIPRNLVGRVEGRSSLGRLGLIVHATAGFIDPGFEGQITLELSNLGNNSIVIYAGDRICQICFEQLSSIAEKPYGHKDRHSKYQGQRGVQESKITEDTRWIENE